MYMCIYIYVCVYVYVYIYAKLTAIHWLTKKSIKYALRAMFKTRAYLLFMFRKGLLIRLWRKRS